MMTSSYARLPMEKWVNQWTIVLMCLCFAVPQQIISHELFPTPPALKKNVEFWTKVYSLYSTNHVIIHDNRDLSIIYGVIDLDAYFAKDEDLATKWKKVEEVKDQYREILQHLAQMPEPVSLDSLNAEERHVYILWSQYDNTDKFETARLSIRAQLGLRDRFKASLERSGAIIDHVIETFHKYGLPADLAYLPHVESLYTYDSCSKVGAVGLWQFIRHTGRLFMTINSAIDERRDPYLATEAAAKLLKLNMQELKSWPLAITAYNHGLTGMKNAILKTGSSDFGVICENYKSRTFGFASRNFYAEFLAARQIARNYKEYFGDIKIHSPWEYQTVVMPRNYYLSTVAEILDIHVDTLVAYNPALRWATIKNKRAIPKGYILRLPPRKGFDPREAFVSKALPTQTRHGSALFTYYSSADSTNRISEEKVLDLLQQPLPPLLQQKETALETLDQNGM